MTNDRLLVSRNKREGYYAGKGYRYVRDFDKVFIFKGCLSLSRAYAAWWLSDKGWD